MLSHELSQSNDGGMTTREAKCPGGGGPSESGLRPLIGKPPQQGRAGVPRTGAEGEWGVGRVAVGGGGGRGG